MKLKKIKKSMPVIKKALPEARHFLKEKTTH